MTSLATELKQVIARRLDAAQPSELITIVGSLCNEPEPPAQQFGVDPDWIEHDDVWNYDRASGLYMTKQVINESAKAWHACMDAADAFTPLPGMRCRAPTIRERLRAVDYTRRNPAIFSSFQHRGDWEWTHTPLKNTDGSPSGYAWGVLCNGGYSYYSYRYYDGFVRAVCVSQ